MEQHSGIDQTAKSEVGDVKEAKVAPIWVPNTFLARNTIDPSILSLDNKLDPTFQAATPSPSIMNTLVLFATLTTLLGLSLAHPQGAAPHHGGGGYKEGPALYNYAYAVHDDYSGANFGQEEKRDGYATSGQYHVALPDGRIQTVTYSVADEYSGFVADVSYSGKATYGPGPHKATPSPSIMNILVLFATLTTLLGLSLAHPQGAAPHHGGGGFKEGPALYNYAYAVHDDYSGANFGQEEKRDGYATSGQYHVALPDGRIQTVTYSVADEYSGFVADVSYSGKATYGPGPHKEGPALYNYAYAVHDDYSGANFGQEEKRDGYATSGQYHVALPDGRIQTVTYSVADEYSGFVADVSYSGKATYGPGPHKGHLNIKLDPTFQQATQSPSIMNSLVLFATLTTLLGLSLAHPQGAAPHHGGGGYKEGPALYNYAYAVHDDYSGANFGQEEKRDGYATSGQYHVALPDGRIQTVTYSVADEYSGYVADVSYSGKATYGPGPHKARMLASMTTWQHPATVLVEYK
eukprot:maker-scaffold132_size323655-snap-gene-2.26 protein:Tk07911 transcript:maker-scaffold132_size323655-snap-gene-2.26-mRNA-1 annotation:"bcs-1 protein"